jgi:hypothetical protein
MKKENKKSLGTVSTVRNGERAETRTGILLVVCFLLGLGAGAYWYHRAAKSNTTPGNEAAGSGQPPIALSESMKSDLQRLDSPVEIRFYKPARPGTLPESLQAFADRVNELLSEYKSEAGGKIHITRLDPQSNSKDEANAKADGVKPLPLPTGDFYYLGLALAYHDRKETISPLVPEWELALPSDLSRAILRLTSPQSAAQPISDLSAANPAAAKAALQDVVRTIPDVTSVSLEDGTRMLREAALAQVKAAVSDMQTQVAAAQQKLAETQGGKSEAEQQAALKQLQQLQGEQTEKFEQIAQRLQDQIAAFKQLKAGAK